MISTYVELQQSIEDHLDRDDLSSQIQNFIVLAEARHKREVRIREMMTREDIDILDRFVDLPDDFLDMRYLRVRTPSGTRYKRYLPDLEELAVHQLTLRSTNEKRCPSAFAVHGESIEFDADPDRPYEGDLFYYTELTPLSDANPSNALLTRAPDVYLYGSLLASAPFLLNDERLRVWGELYANSKDTLNSSERQARRGGPLVAKVQGPTP